MNNHFLTRCVAGVTALVGGGWTVFCTSPLWYPLFSVNGHESTSASAGLWVTLTCLSIPGLLALFCGLRLFRRRTRSAIEAAVGALMFFVVLIVGMRLWAWVGFDYRTLSPVLLTTLPVVLGSLALARVLINTETSEHVRYVDLIGKGYLQWIAIVAYVVLGDVADYFGIYNFDMSDPVITDPVGPIIRLVPILVAVLFYKLLRSVVTRYQGQALAPKSAELGQH